MCTATGDTSTPEGPGRDLGDSAADASVHGGRLGHAPDPRSYTHPRSATSCGAMPCGGPALRAGAGCIPSRPATCDHAPTGRQSSHAVLAGIYGHHDALGVDHTAVTVDAMGGYSVAELEATERWRDHLEARRSNSTRLLRKADFRRGQSTTDGPAWT